MYRTENFKTGLCRISYAQGLHKPRSSNGGKEKHSVTLIYPKDQVDALRKAVAEVVENEWGEKGVERFKKGFIHNPIIPGDGKQARDKESGNLKPGMGEDVVFIRPTSGVEYPPKVFDPDVLPMDPKEVKSGWWGYPVLNAFAWHNAENGDGISFGINMWQHVKEDEVLGGEGGGNPDDYFSKETVDTPDDGGAGGVASSMFD